MAARAPGGQHLGGRARRRPCCPPPSPASCSRWPASSASTSSSPRRCGRTPTALAALLERGAARRRGSGPSRRSLPALDRRRSACGVALSRWSRRSPPASGPSARSTSATSSRSPPAWPPSTPRSARRSGPPTGPCCSTSTRTPGTPSGCCCARCSARGRATPVRPGRPGGHGRRRPLPVDLRLARGERGQPRRASAPTSRRPDGAPPTSTACSRASATRRRCSRWPTPCRRRCARLPARSASGRCGRARAPAPGDVRVALLPDVAAELDWMADAIAAQWRRRGGRGAPPPTSAVLVRRRADMDADRRGAARPRPARRGGRPRRAARHPGGPRPGQRPAAGRRPAGRARRRAPAHRGALAAGRRRPRRAVGPRPRAGAARRRPAPSAPPADARLGALPGEHAEQAGPRRRARRPGRARPLLARPASPGSAGSPGSWAGCARGRRRRSPTSSPTPSALLLLDAETAARPGPVGRAHLDAFADVVADFAAGAEVSTLPALLDYLETAERAEDGFAPGEVEVAPDRVQVLTVHAAKGLEWEVVAVPHLVAQVFPGRKISGTLADRPVRAARPAARRRRGPARARPAPPGADRKAVEDAVNGARRGARRAAAGRGAAAVLRRAHPRRAGAAAVRAPLGPTGEKPAAAVGVPRRGAPTARRRGASSTGPSEPGRRRGQPGHRSSQPTALWPADPLGARSRRRPRRAPSWCAPARCAARLDARSGRDRPRRRSSRCSTVRAAARARGRDRSRGLGRRRRRAARRAGRRPGASGRRSCPPSSR